MLTSAAPARWCEHFTTNTSSLPRFCIEHLGGCRKTVDALLPRGPQELLRRWFEVVGVAKLAIIVSQCEPVP